MPSHGGPKLLGKENLVFAYDVADTKNSYKGEPTTNLAGPDFTTWDVDASGYSTTGTRTILSTYYCRIEDSSSNTRQRKWIYGLSGNTNYTFSVKFKKISGSPTLRFQIQPYNGGSYITTYFPTTTDLRITDIDGWQTATYSITTPSGTDRVIWFIQDGDDYTGYSHSFELKEIQLEQNSHVTSFSSSSRSATQSLLPIAGNLSIDVSNVSFNSNSQIVFDGTNDYIAMDTSIGNFGTSDWTINCWWKSNGTQAAYTSIIGQGFIYPISAGGWCFKVKNHSNVNFLSFSYATSGEAIVNVETSAACNDGKWHNLTAVRNGSIVTMYMDGVTVGSFSPGASYSFGTGATTYIGYNPRDSAYINGYLNSLMIYNRALSSIEVQTNYNQNKTRFNLN
jgi:hypothetical protein